MTEQESPREVLDFLYRDNSRLASYYAQVFQGHLVSFEETDSTREASTKTGKLGMAPLGCEGSKTNEENRVNRRTFNPHDIVTIETLGFLNDQRFISNDLQRAPDGAIVRVHGVLAMVDKSLINMMMSFTQAFFLEQAKRPTSGKHDRNRMAQEDFQQKIALKALEQFLPPSTFVLELSNGRRVAGVLKDEGIEESLQGYYVRHGAGGLANITVIGVKEAPSDDLFNLEAAPGAANLFSVVRQLTPIFSQTLFPDDAIRISPIVIFRTLSPIPEGR